MTQPRGCFQESDTIAEPAVPTFTARARLAGPLPNRNINAALLAHSAMASGAGENGARARSALGIIIARSGCAKLQTYLCPRLSKVHPVSAAPDSSQNEAVTGSKEKPLLPIWSGSALPV